MNYVISVKSGKPGSIIHDQVKLFSKLEKKQHLTQPVIKKIFSVTVDLSLDATRKENKDDNHNLVNIPNSLQLVSCSYEITHFLGNVCSSYFI